VAVTAAAVTATAAQVPAGDGRRLRREQNREAVIDALLDFFAAGIYNPSSTEVATRAGLSPRSLFRYFDDIDDLHRAAADRQIQIALPLLQLAVGPEDATAAKVEAVARSRVRLFERSGPAGRALRACAHRDELLTGELQRSRAFLAGQLSDLFAAELAELAGRADAVLEAIDVLCSFESYDLLSRRASRPPAAIVAVLVTALTALLTGQPDA
jgi:AcrR family transcriptional regulator